ncbi:acetyltransferase [Penicillium tannophilum]|nr:acetyltransferase [Penicillium tannophilum]
MVATHPDYRRQGAASMLLQRGCDIADAEGVEMYVSASKDGASLYAKFGFVDYSIAGQETVSMVRHVRCVD